MAEAVNNHRAFFRSIAELSRGDCKQSEYQKAVLSPAVIRRIDTVLEPSKDEVLDQYGKYKDRADSLDAVLEKVSGGKFYDTPRLTFGKLLDDSAMIADNLRAHIAAFSPSAPSSSLSSASTTRHSSRRQ